MFDQILNLLDLIANGLLVVVIIIVTYNLYYRPKNKPTDFISIASHQLRTPLTIMKGYLSMILEGSLGEVRQTKIKAALGAVYQANERLIRLTDNLLGVSQLENKTIQLVKEDVDFPSLVHEVVKEIKPKAAAKNLVLTIALSCKKFFIITDELMLRQVLLNILDNAIKYTKQGGITITAKLNKKNLYVSITDTGPGLNEADLKDLFDKFERREVNDEKPESFGLGLYVCRLIIEAHQGRIWAETRGDGFGFKISFEIPR